MFMKGNYAAGSASTVPVHIDAFQDQRLVVQLEDHQKKDQEQHHEDAHDWGGTPAGDNLAVLGVEGTEQIAQTGALSHNGAEVSGEVQSGYCRGPGPKEGQSCREM